jgi:hypothetical protein
MAFSGLVVSPNGRERIGEEFDRAGLFGDGLIDKNKAAVLDIAGKPLPQIRAESRICLNPDDGEALLQIEVGIFADVAADIEN